MPECPSFSWLTFTAPRFLSLYNAINGTSYTDEDAIEVNTLEDVIYLNMRNDLSFLLDCRLNLYEQQSTANPNMPLRGFMYCASLYSKVIGDKVHSAKLLKIPTPQMVVFYNGEKHAPEREILKLSDAFIKPTDKEFPVEFTVLALNINSGYNEDIVQSCETLAGYVTLVTKVREFSVMETGEKVPNETAVSKAVDWCIEHGYIADFLRKHRWEVIDMLLTEYNEDKVHEIWRADGYEEGYDDGVAEGRAQAIKLLLTEGALSKEQIAKALKESLEKIEAIEAEMLTET